MDLADWLLEQIAADEQDPANAKLNPGRGRQVVSEHQAVANSDGALVCGNCDGILTVDPDPEAWGVAGPIPTVRQEAPYPCGVLRWLAEIYADRPGYLEWALA